MIDNQNYATLYYNIHHLYLDRFRRKPAITTFDKPFTPNYNSNQNFATFTTSVLEVLTSQPDRS